MFAAPEADREEIVTWYCTSESSVLYWFTSRQGRQLSLLLLLFSVRQLCDSRATFRTRRAVCKGLGAQHPSSDILGT